MYTILGRGVVERQGIQGAVDGVKNSFSSWDNCMAKAYCKWPVIVAIVVGSLIILSILFCCIRCLCCGVQCCCGICSCFNACCPAPRRRGEKSSSSYNNNNPPYRPVGPPQQPYNAQYQSHGPPAYASPTFNPAPAPAYNHGRPQYAQFDVSKPSNPDALPSMPSWDHAENRKVEVFDDPSDSVEMNDLDHQGHKPGTADSQAPMIAGFAAGGLSPSHARPGANSRAGSQDPYGQHSQSPYDQHSQSLYDQHPQSPYDQHPQSPYDQRGQYGGDATSPYGERESYMSAGSHPLTNGGGQYHQPPPGDGFGGGAAIGGYRGAAPAPQRQLHSPQYGYHEDAPRVASPQNQQYPAQQDSPPQPRPQLQIPQPQQPQQTYQAFSPGMASSAAPAPSYPGQRTYQTGSGQRSPVSPVSPQQMDFGLHGVEPTGPHPEQYRPQQAPSDANYQPPAWRRSVDRKPVGGSWREI